MSKNNTRRHYRIPYPIGARPMGKLGKAEFWVLDLSEEGCKIEFTAPVTLMKGQIIKSDVTFHDGAIFPIQGKVLRQETETHVVMLLTEGIPLKKIMAEQRYLIKNYNSTIQDSEDED